MAEKSIDGVGKKLLDTHSKLFKSLIEIPLKRKISFKIDEENGLQIGKPRFDPPEYPWSPELLQQLRDHLQDIWSFFDKYSFYFDYRIYPLINWDNGQNNKQSIIYLLSCNVWGPSAVYGAYLIEKEGNQTRISYYRREKKVRSSLITETNETRIGEWIMQDAIQQITNHFTFLWQKLETEIKTCMTERYQKKEIEIETPENLRAQFAQCHALFPISKEGCLLLLGRISEHWLKVALMQSDRTDFVDLIGIARNIKLFDENEQKMFNKIRLHNNDFKHKITYSIDQCPLQELLESFEHFLQNTK